MGTLDEPAPLPMRSGLELRDRQADGGGRALADEEPIALLDLVQEQSRQLRRSQYRLFGAGSSQLGAQIGQQLFLLRRQVEVRALCGSSHERRSNRFI